MAKVSYNGPFDARRLVAADLKKAGVENFSATTFAQRELVEVPDDVATALLENPGLFGPFSRSEDESAVTLEEATDGTPQTNVSTADTGGTTRNTGASTSGRSR